jgi:hypothetical protein
MDGISVITRYQTENPVCQSTYGDSGKGSYKNIAKEMHA